MMPLPTVATRVELRVSAFLSWNGCAFSRPRVVLLATRERGAHHPLHWAQQASAEFPGAASDHGYTSPLSALVRVCDTFGLGWRGGFLSLPAVP